MKEKLWIILVACFAYWIDKELYKAIDYLREQVRVLVEQQEKQNIRSNALLARATRSNPVHKLKDHNL
jgi:hypothetical protein